MNKGENAVLTVEKCLLKGYGKEYSDCTVHVWKYNAKEECIYFVLDKGELIDVSLDIIYGCEIFSKDEIVSCTGRVKERYYNEHGKVLKFEIENGFYKINLNSVDKY